MNTAPHFRGERMRTWRKLLDIRQDALSVKVGVTRTQITNLETGVTEPSIAVLVAIARELKVSTDWLLGLSDVPAHDAPPALLDTWRRVAEAETALMEARKHLKSVQDEIF